MTKIGDIYISDINPLDIVLFRHDNYISNTIMCCENLETPTIENWSHSALVINTELININGMKRDELYLLESLNTTHTADVHDIWGVGKFGVQIRKLEDVITNIKLTKGSMAGLYKLKNNPLMTNSPLKKDIINNFYMFYSHICDATYDFKYLIKAILPNCCLEMCCWNSYCGCVRTNDMTSFFCSELVVSSYQHMGLISEKIDPETISPVEITTSIGLKFSDVKLF